MREGWHVGGKSGRSAERALLEALKRRCSGSEGRGGGSPTKRATAASCAATVAVPAAAAATAASSWALITCDLHGAEAREVAAASPRLVSRRR